MNTTTLLAGQILEVIRYKLEEGETVHLGKEREAYLHPLVGEGTIVSDGDRRRIYSRRSVFDLPMNGFLFEECCVAARSALDFVVAYADAPAKKLDVGPALYVHTIGHGCAEREVREILGAGGPTKRIRCGETINAVGGWSSWPPHSFDKDPLNVSGFEEVFLYFTDPKDGWGIQSRTGFLSEQGLLAKCPVNDMVRVHSGQHLKMPLGSHPVVAGPGTRLMYVWFYVSPVDKIYPKWAEDVGTYR